MGLFDCDCADVVCRHQTATDRRRACTDVGCFFLFLLVTAGAVILIVFSAWDVDFYRNFEYPRDYLGQHCGAPGSPTENLSYAFYPTLDADLRNFGAASAAVSWVQFSPRRLCVAACPVSSSPLTAPVAYGGPDYPGAADDDPLYRVAAFDSLAIHAHCIPRPMAAAARPPRLLCVEPACDDAAVAALFHPRAPSCEGEAWVVDDVGDTTPPALDSCALAVREESAAEYVPAAATADSLAATLGYARYLGAAFAAYDAVDAAWREVLIFGLAAPAGVLLIWIVVLQFWAGLLVWTSLLSLVASLAALSYFLCSRGGLLGDISLPADAAALANRSAALHGASMTSAAFADADAVAAAANQTADRVLAAASLVCLSLVVVSLALWRRAIHRSICVVKEAAYAVWFLPQLLLCPIPTMAALVTIACCAVAAVLLLLAETPTHLSERLAGLDASIGLSDAAAAGDREPSSGEAMLLPLSRRALNVNATGGGGDGGPSFLPPSDGAGGQDFILSTSADIIFAGGAPNSTRVGFSGSFGGVADASRGARLAYFILVALWWWAFVAATGWTIIAGAVSRWFFRASNAKRNFLGGAFIRVLWFHLGSMAFGAAVVGAAGVLRWTIATFTYHVGRARRTNPLAWLCVGCATCAARCVQRSVEYITSYSYVLVAMNGRGFCKSCAQSFTMIGQNPAMVAVNWTVKRLLSLCMVASTVASCTLTCYLYLVYVRGSCHLGLCTAAFAKAGRGGALDPVYPALLAGILAAAVASAVASVFSCAVDTIFCCALQDIDASEGRHLPERMLLAFGFSEDCDPIEEADPLHLAADYFDRRAAAKEPLPPGGALSGIYAAGAAEAPGQAGVPPLVLGGSQRMPSVGAANVVEQRM